jgi:hypothetical protein
MITPIFASFNLNSWGDTTPVNLGKCDVCCKQVPLLCCSGHPLSRELNLICQSSNVAFFPVGVSLKAQFKGWTGYYESGGFIFHYVHIWHHTLSPDCGGGCDELVFIIDCVSGSDPQLFLWVFFVRDLDGYLANFSYSDTRLTDCTDLSGTLGRAPQCSTVPPIGSLTSSIFAYFDVTLISGKCGSDPTHRSTQWVISDNGNP